MSYSFNLIDQKWVPCVRHDGYVEELSLYDALVEAHTYRELGGESPLVTASLYRFLLAVLHRVFGPEDRDAWEVLWKREQWDARAISAYLEKWYQRFDLFDQRRPFYQADHRIGPSPVGDLLHELSKDDTFYDHRTLEGVLLTPAEAARHLLAAQAFGRWMTKGPYGQLPFGIYARGIVFLAKGDNLFQDLALNLVRYPTRDDWFPHTEKDAPCWEMDDPFTPERSVPLGYLDYLTWQSRRILLLPEKKDGRLVIARAKIAPGLRMKDEMRNPAMQHINCKKKGMKSWVAFQEGRALWRDSAPLFMLPPKEETARDSYPPIILEWLASLLEEQRGLSPRQTKLLVGFGMAGDLNQYRVHFYRREELPLPLAFLEDQNLIKHLEVALGKAEDVGKQLWGALSTLAIQTLFHKEEASSRQEREEQDRLLNAWGAERHYWAALEIPFYSLLTNLPQDAYAANQMWEEALRRAVWEAFDAVAENLGEDPLTLKAIVLARGRLGGSLAKVLNEKA